jgi:hypothetical protein
MKNKELTPEDFIAVEIKNIYSCEGCFFKNNPFYDCDGVFINEIGKLTHRCEEGYIYKLKEILPKESAIKELEYQNLLIDKKILIDYLKIAVNLLIYKNTSLEIIVKFKNVIKDFELK